MLLAVDVVDVGIFTGVGSLAGTTDLLKEGLGCRLGRSGLGLEDFFGEGFRGDRRKGSDTALQVVPAMRRVSRDLNMWKRISWTYCQSLRIWARCNSLFLNATWQLLQVYG